MLCLDVLKNGKRVARAGLRRGSVSASVHWASHDDRTEPEALRDLAVVPGLMAWVSGFSTMRPLRREHVTWARLRRVRLGDEIVIRVTRSGRSTTPASREPVPNRRHTKTGSLDRCSFCRRWRGDREVDAPSMAFRGTAAICAQCVFLAAALVEANAARTLHLRALRAAACSFCGRRRARLVGSKGMTLCTTCLKRFRRRF